MTMGMSRTRWRELSLSIFGLILLIGLWSLLTSVLEVLPSVVLPSPLEVLQIMIDIREVILRNLWPTLLAGFLGFVIALGLGVVFAIAVNENDRLRKTLMPYLIGGNMIPRVAVAPLIIFYVDVQPNANVIIAAWIAFFPMFLNIKEGLKDVDDDQLMFFDLLGSSTLYEYRYLRFPTALPYIFDAMKLGIITAYVGAVIGEFVASDQGMGYLTLLAMINSNVPLAMASVLVIGFATTVFIYVIFVVQDRVMFWEDAGMFS